MTREGAISVLECMAVDLTGCMGGLSKKDPLEDVCRQRLEAINTAQSALRPVSRERAEKVFGGKWEEETYTTVSGRGRVIHSKKYTCSVCGKANGRAKTNFCPHCGASQTDEAVEMVMERMEALKDGSTTD